MIGENWCDMGDLTILFTLVSNLLEEAGDELTDLYSKMSDTYIASIVTSSNVFSCFLVSCACAFNGENNKRSLLLLFEFPKERIKSVVFTFSTNFFTLIESNLLCLALISDVFKEAAVVVFEKEAI